MDSAVSSGIKGVLKGKNRFAINSCSGSAAGMWIADPSFSSGKINSLTPDVTSINGTVIESVFSDA